MKTVRCPQNNVEIYITQSWLNYIDENQYHPMHYHPNSVVSGVLYLDCDKDNDRIHFFSPLTYATFPLTYMKRNVMFGTLLLGGLL